jgi:tellurite resistance protein
MFRNIFGPHSDPATHQANQQTEAALTTAADAATTAGDTATVRRIVAKLEAMPPERARLVAAAAYTLARAANADMDISDVETAAIETALQDGEALDEPTAVLVTEMAKLQAKTVGGTEDYVVTREFAKLATEAERLQVLRACFLISAANGSISAEESAEVNEIARELDIEPATLNAIRAEFHDQLSAVQEVRRIAGTEA